MRTDAMIYSLADSNKRLGKNRMDRMNKTEKIAHLGSDELLRRSNSVASFKEAYKSVAQSNAGANNRCAERKLSEKVSKKSSAVQSSTVIQVDKSKSEEPVKKSDKKERTPYQQAQELLRDSLVELRDLLHLNVVDGLEGVAISPENEESVEQIAEILHSLKNITQLLEAAAQCDQSIEVGESSISGSEASNLASSVKAIQFKIELASGMIGISEAVAEKVTVKSDIPWMGSIPLAINPLERSQSPADVAKVFDFLADESSEFITSLEEKIAAIVKDAGGEDSVDNVELMGNLEKNPVTKANLLAHLGSSILRDTLKIDNAAAGEKLQDGGKGSESINQLADSEIVLDEVTELNEDAVESLKKLKLPFFSDLVMANNPEQVQQGADSTAPTVDFSDKLALSLSTMETKSATGLPKHVEQSVFQQFSEKFNSMVRSGVHEIRIQLRPEALGEVSLRIRMEGDVVMARIQVENQQVKQILESGFTSLKDSLQQQNLQAGTFEVNVGQHDHAGNQNGGQNREHSSEFSQRGFDNPQQEGDSSYSDSSTSALSKGDETGRRFGNNSMEYYA